LPVSIEVSDKLQHSSDRFVLDRRFDKGKGSSIDIRPLPVKHKIKSTLSKAASPNDSAVAVVIGNAAYDKIRAPAKFAINDARAVKKYLLEVMRYKEHNIIYVENATAADFLEIFGSQNNPQGKLHHFIEPGKSDVFIYYSGHGGPDVDSRKAYLVPVDSAPLLFHLSAYPLNLFYKNVAALPSRKRIVVLDTCFSGNSDAGPIIEGRPIVIRVNKEAPSIVNTAIFTSSSPEQISLFYNEKKHGLFTYFFLQGLSGSGDTDQDRVLTANELYEFIKKGMHPVVRRRGLIQQPILIQNTETEIVRYR